jgi:hypothetical protein
MALTASLEDIEAEVRSAASEAPGDVGSRDPAGWRCDAPILDVNPEVAGV